jgi:thiamine-monophosphate kinase
MLEFDWIEQIKNRINPRADVLLGIGDDAALVKPANGMSLAISSDTFALGSHFFLGTDPADIGYKALAVNLSDLAAMAATPRWFTLAMSLPDANFDVLRMIDGMLALADQHQIALIGGDTTKGALSISITVIGEVSPGMALTRRAARVGDGVFVSGDLGRARAAVERRYAKQPGIAAFAERLDRPTARVELALALRSIAHSCIDVSDGLLPDLTHLCRQSQVSATVHVEQLPLHPTLLEHEPLAIDLALLGGDDYELCFTAPTTQADVIQKIAVEHGVAITCIGEIFARQDSDVQVFRADQPYIARLSAFEHFAAGQ